MSFAFIQITDHHLFESESGLVRGFSTAHSYRAVLRHIAQYGLPNAVPSVDFIVSLGDFVDPPTDAAYLAIRARYGITGSAPRQPDDKLPAAGPLRIAAEGLGDMPIYFLPGNHDDRVAFFRSLLGQPAASLLNTSFIHKGVQFVCLDWGTDATSVAYPETLAFLQQALAADQPSIILTHHQVAPIGIAWLDSFIAPELDRFWEIVRGKNVLGVLAGHVHHTHEQVVESIPVWTLRSTGFQFARTPEPLTAMQAPHYRVVTVQDGTLKSRIVEVPL